MAQIEPRVISTIIGDTAFVAQCESGISPYQAHAANSMGFRGTSLKKEEPKMYSLAKARLLSLGFQAGWHKFIGMAKTYGVPEEIFDAEVPEGTREKFENYLNNLKDKKHLRTYEIADEKTKHRYTVSWKIVTDFRQSNPLLTGAWKRIGNMIEQSAGEDMTLALPSGNKLVYRNIRQSLDGFTYLGTKHGKVMRTRIYSGLAFENVVQSIARDIFGLSLIRMDEAGFDLRMQAHDEAVAVLHEGQSVNDMVKLMSVRPSWMKGIPLAAEGVESERYLK
jgi:hypothetical protein